VDTASGRLAEDWGDGSAIIGTAWLFTFAHSHHLLANAYSVEMITSLFVLAAGVVFAWTRSLVPAVFAPLSSMFQ
jgi:membrane protease YdiL (CAAX protease family)